MNQGAYSEGMILKSELPLRGRKKKSTNKVDTVI